MHSDDLKNPEYRKGRRKPAAITKSEPIRRPPPSEDARRASFAAETARAAFGRFYWSDELRLRMEVELKASRRRKRQEELSRRRRFNGAGR